MIRRMTGGYNDSVHMMLECRAKAEGANSNAADAHESGKQKKVTAMLLLCLHIYKGIVCLCLLFMAFYRSIKKCISLYTN